MTQEKPDSPATQALRAEEARWSIPTYAQLPIVVVRGEGCTVWDSEGRAWLDLYGGHAVALTGHCHPKVVAAIREQAGQLLFYSNVVGNDVRAHAMKAIADVAPKGMSRSFLCNSGAEANEGAIKIARRTTGHRDVLSMLEGFHGRTMGALSATALGHYYQDYQPGVPDHGFLRFGDLEHARRAITERTACVMLEPIQSMGGMHAATGEYLRGLRELCDQRGALLVFDEVQTGPGRTGAWWYGENPEIGVRPDVITTAKGLASGLPVGAVIVRDEIAEKVREGDNGTTFGGGPVVCAAVLATLAVLRDEELLANANARFAQLAEVTRGIPGVTGTRGRGLLCGVTLDRPAGPVVKALRAHRILASTTTGDANVIRLLPPLVLAPADVDRFAAALRELLA